MRLDPQFLPLGDDFPEPHMDRKPIIPFAAQRTWADMWPLDRELMITRMLCHGGGFVRCIASAFAKADPENAHRLAAAFPELVQKYGPQWGKK